MMRVPATQARPLHTFGLVVMRAFQFIRNLYPIEADSDSGKSMENRVIQRAVQRRLVSPWLFTHPPTGVEG
jgi:hypothetical protein